MARFHLPDLPAEGALAALPDDEARHLTQVLRLATGAAVRVFDGRGREHAARVEVAARHRVDVRVGAPVLPAPESPTAITLAAALLKGDKFDDVVRDAVMVGAHAVQPLVTARVEVPAARAGSVARLDRWRRIALSATKQCGRAVLADVAPPATLQEALAVLPEPWIVLVEPAAVVSRAPLPPAPAQASVIAGPEGGWAPDELEALRARGAVCLSLGGRTLRADAVALIGLSVLMYEWDAL